MLTNKDIRVENGNIVINGDKYPLDGQPPEAIMQIVKDNSDTTPTENSDAPITSGGVYTALSDKQDSITNLSYITTGLTPNANCSIKAGGYIQIGKLVIVNIRILVTATGAAIAGLPTPAISDANNGVGGMGYNSSDGSASGYFINNANGTLNMANSVSSGDILCSFVYAAN